MKKRAFEASVLALPPMTVGLETTQEKGKAIFDGAARGLVFSEIGEE